jgi:mono/diheme cytochrome c family protein
MRFFCSALVMVAAGVVQAQAPPPDSRGELLYRTYCIGCHTTQVHWRGKALASDWAGLVAQVERWQRNAKLGWSGADVDAVARYLNAAYYRFPSPDGTPVGEGPPLHRVARRD